jgi:hypothetical protein
MFSSRVIARLSPGLTAGLCLAVVSSHQGWAQQSEQTVIDADGFRVAGNPPARMQSVAGLKLTGTRGAEVLLSCGGELQLYTCKADTCEVDACTQNDAVDVRKWSFTPRAAAKTDVSIFSKLLRRDPKPAAIAAGRSMGGPVDAVVLQDEKGVHWAPALAGVLEGHYCLVVGTLPPSAQTWTTTLQWDRRRESEGLASVTGLPPGLYSLRKGPVGGAGCQPDANEDAGWVLVATSAQFPPLSAEWRSYAESIDELERSGVSPSLTATLRRAALSALAEP